jgi:hypothetical protein
MRSQKIRNGAFRSAVLCPNRPRVPKHQNQTIPLQFCHGAEFLRVAPWVESWDGFILREGTLARIALCWLQLHF